MYLLFNDFRRQIYGVTLGNKIPTIYYVHFHTNMLCHVDGWMLGKTSFFPKPQETRKVTLMWTILDKEQPLIIMVSLLTTLCYNKKHFQHNIKKQVTTNVSFWHASYKFVRCVFKNVLIFWNDIILNWQAINILNISWLSKNTHVRQFYKPIVVFCLWPMVYPLN